MDTMQILNFATDCMKLLRFAMDLLVLFSIPINPMIHTQLYLLAFDEHLK